MDGMDDGNARLFGSALGVFVAFEHRVLEARWFC